MKHGVVDGEVVSVIDPCQVVCVAVFNEGLAVPTVISLGLLLQAKVNSRSVHADIESHEGSETGHSQIDSVSIE